MNLLKKSLKPFVIVLFFLLTSCHQRYVEVRTEYLDKTYLASQQVNTSDPLRECFQGQQLIVRWKLPRACFKEADVQLKVTVRYGDRTIEEFSAPLKNARGWWLLRIINAEYWDRGGMLSYKAEIFKGNLLLESYQHHIWCDIIEINTDNETDNEENLEPSLPPEVPIPCGLVP